MRKHYSLATIKYRGYIIEGIGNEYELYHPDGLIGTFPTCSEAKAFVDKELKELADIWNKSVLEEAYPYEIMA